MKRLATQALVYFGVAMLMLQPAPGIVPGGSRTDVWNSLWNLWFSHRELSAGRLPWATDLLNFPDGGTVLLPDLFASLFALVGVPLLGVAGTYSALLLLRLTASGVVAHRFATDWLKHTGLDADAAERAGFVAGVAFSTAPVLLAGAQSGTTEAVNGAWPALAAWMCWRAIAQGQRRAIPWAALALLGATIANWYGAVVAFVFAGFIALFTPRTAENGWNTRLFVLGGGLLLALPVVGFTYMTHSDPGHIATRSMAILENIRRSFGSADLFSWFWPLDDADIAIVNPSERGQGYLHTTYLGVALIAGSLVTLKRRVPGAHIFGLAGLVCMLLALGPVLWINGEATIDWMPYALLEGFPGFSSLSLLWRFGVGTALAVALLAAAVTRGRQMWVFGACVIILLEVAFVSPLAKGVATSNIETSSALLVLQAAPKGAVVTVPSVRLHPDLWRQTTHQQPVTGGINQRLNQTSLDWFQIAVDAPLDDALDAAKDAGIRYVMVHKGSTLREQPIRGFVSALENAHSPLAEDETLTIYALW